ncbi:twin-arginine translocase TatA/TatE family subunit [Perlucidibaca aquatica]|uniref:twin-arginine translocase TatA/TatE family subunit n=1 Tax=Perlucidibaca aquatica TaxID=1852776 RepID=UPI00083B5A3E|nr:twin-arginine translocase TatA/TatE family subunit [Perlucidibaca aquatica]
MSGLSLPHILLLLGIVILVFGTSKLKNLGKDLGGAIKGFKESMKGEDEPVAPTPPPAQIQQAQTPPAQPVQQPTDQKSGQ